MIKSVSDTRTDLVGTWFNTAGSKPAQRPKSVRPQCQLCQSFHSLVNFPNQDVTRTQTPRSPNFPIPKLSAAAAVVESVVDYNDQLASEYLLQDAPRLHTIPQRLPLGRQLSFWRSQCCSTVGHARATCVPEASLGFHSPLH